MTMKNMFNESYVESRGFFCKLRGPFSSDCLNAGVLPNMPIKLTPAAKFRCPIGWLNIAP
jgi:hypothetical protein